MPMSASFIEVVDLAAVLASGLSGALLASNKRFDVGGLAFLTMVAGLGGGLIRDVLLQRALEDREEAAGGLARGAGELCEVGLGGGEQHLGGGAGGDLLLDEIAQDDRDAGLNGLEACRKIPEHCRLAPRFPACSIRRRPRVTIDTSHRAGHVASDNGSTRYSNRAAGRPGPPGRGGAAAPRCVADKARSGSPSPG